ncbi:hypothetical protein GGF38_001586 [Coemansia sp. RSA 25]|nr:hypothetical protein GGF38_001586 [Coemansia sp. RSA 25]
MTWGRWYRMPDLEPGRKGRRQEREESAVQGLPEVGPAEVAFPLAGPAEEEPLAAGLAEEELAEEELAEAARCIAHLAPDRNPEEPAGRKAAWPEEAASRPEEAASRPEEAASPLVEEELCHRAGPPSRRTAASQAS